MNQITALNQMSANVNVGMDEVVSVFVSKYEDGLFAKKDELAAVIRTLKQELADFDKTITDMVDPTEYEAKVPNLGMTFKMGDVSIHWDKHWQYAANTFVIDVNMFDSSAKREGSVFTKNIIKPIPSKIVKQRTEVKQAIDDKNAELMEVMGQIKGVGRKERQIRGRISELKLAESGMADLLTNSDMLKLVEIK